MLQSRPLLEGRQNNEGVHSLQTVTRQTFKSDTFQLQFCMYACHVFIFPS